MQYTSQYGASTDTDPPYLLLLCLSQATSSIWGAHAEHQLLLHSTACKVGHGHGRGPTPLLLNVLLSQIT